MSRADGVHSSTCLHIAEPCDRPSCSWCSCDEEPLADWERDLLNEANATATLTAQRDAARDIAARLEGELARVRSVVLGLDHYRECPGAYGAYNACDCGHSDLMEATGGEVLTGSALRTPWPHPDAVIAEGES